MQKPKFSSLFLNLGTFNIDCLEKYYLKRSKPGGYNVKINYCETTDHKF